MRRFLIPVGALALALVVGCGGSGGSKGGNGGELRPGGLSIKIDWPKTETRVIPDVADSIRITVVPKGTDITDPHRSYGTEHSILIQRDDFGEKTIDHLRPGEYLVLAQANTDASVSAFGSDPVVIEAGKHSTFDVVMASTVTHFKLVGRIDGAQNFEAKVPVGGSFRLPIGVDQRFDPLTFTPASEGASGDGTILVSAVNHTNLTLEFPGGGFSLPRLVDGRKSIETTYTPEKLGITDLNVVYRDGIPPNDVELTGKLEIDVKPLEFATVPLSGDPIKSSVYGRSPNGALEVVSLLGTNEIRFGQAVVTPNFAGKVPTRIDAWSGDECLVIGNGLLASVHRNGTVRFAATPAATLGTLADVDIADDDPSVAYVVRTTPTSSSLHRVRKGLDGSITFEETPVKSAPSGRFGRVAALSETSFYFVIFDGGKWIADYNYVDAQNRKRNVFCYLPEAITAVDEIESTGNVMLVRTGNTVRQCLRQATSTQVGEKVFPEGITSFDYLRTSDGGSFLIAGPAGIASGSATRD